MHKIDRNREAIYEVERKLDAIAAAQKLGCTLTVWEGEERHDREDDAWPGPAPKDLSIKATPKQVVQAIVKGGGMPRKALLKGAGTGKPKPKS